MPGFWEGATFHKGTIYPVTDTKLILKWLEMNIRSLCPNSLLNDQVNKANDRSLIGRIDQIALLCIVKFSN
jgi:hypothetical protein